MTLKWLRSLARHFFLPPAPPSIEASLPRPTVRLLEPEMSRPMTGGQSRPPRWKNSFGMTPKQVRHWQDFVTSLLLKGVDDGLEWPGSLTLAKLRIRWLPASFTVRGDLDLRQCQRLRQIGDGLTILGSLKIGGRCAGSLWYEYETPPLPMSRDGQPPLASLPERLRVDGTLEVRSCHHLRSLPEQMDLRGGLHIEDCHRFETLAESLTVVHGDLTIKGCPQFKRLPPALHVHGNLNLIGLPLEELPTDLRVDGSLRLENCPRLTTLPAELRIEHDLVIHGLPVDSLPEKLQIRGDLVIRRCLGLTALPSGIHAGRDLILEQLPIAELPLDFLARRNLVVRQCPELTAIPVQTNVGANVRFHRCDKLAEIPAGLGVRDSLKLTRCPKLQSLPPGLTVPGVLDLGGCTALSTLGPKTRVGFANKRTPRQAALVLADCVSLMSVPKDLRVNGPIDVAGSGLKELPRSLASNRVLWRGMGVLAKVVFKPESLSAAEILSERNAEIRRVMLDRLGCDNVLAKAQATTIDEDTDAGGPRRLVEVVIGRRQRYLNCRCPSTARVYLLRVPPQTATCHQAAAWLAGFENPSDYQPILET